MTYYTRVFDVDPGAANLSKQVEDEFDRIASAIDTFEGDHTTDVSDLTSALALKAPLDSPALTGTPTAPTQLVSDDSTKLATTAFVQDVLGAGGALLPPQSGQAGKFLSTDGTSASWEDVAAAPSWETLTGKPTTLAGFGITNGQHAVEWLEAGRRIATAPVRIDFNGASVRRVSADRVEVTPHIPHNLLIAAGVH
jgi:hypothetical protein